MSVLALYLVLLQATLASFSGFGSLPQVREDLVVRHRVLSDEGLNRAVLVARTSPGAQGIYIVSVGYQVRGLEGAIAGWLALATPALLVIPIWAITSKHMGHARVRGAIEGLVLGSAILIVWATVPLAREILEGWLTVLAR